jgi:hypothetical protein
MSFLFQNNTQGVRYRQSNNFSTSRLNTYYPSPPQGVRDRISAFQWVVQSLIGGMGGTLLKSHLQFPPAVGGNGTSAKAVG